MPTPRSKLAPYFTGDIEEPIGEFLQEYEELADSNGLTSRQKVETVVRYVNPTERDLWRSLPGYTRRDWDDLCDDLREEYVDPTPQGRYSKQKLQDFASRTARTLMADEQAVLKYYRSFNKLSKPLLDSGRITQGERDATFWCGFHPEDRKALRERLIAKQPDKPRGQAFDYKDVLKIARAIFSGDDDFLLQEPPPRHYDSDRARERRTERHGRDRTRAPLSFEGQEPGDEEAPLEDEDDYEPPRRGHRYSSPRVETRTVRFQGQSRDEEDRELDELITQLHSLSVRDTAYARLHARCARRFPDVARNLPKPEYRMDPPVVSYSYQASAAPPPPTAQQWPYQAASALPPPTAQQWPYQAASAPPPPTAQQWPTFHPASVSTPAQASAPPPPPVIASSADSFYRPRPCAFCMFTGHLIRDCAQVGEYLRAGRATHINGKIYLPNGQPIPNDGTRRGLKVAIDAWWAAQSTPAPAPAPAQARVVFTREPPPHTDTRSAPTSRIEEVVESHILQVSQVINLAEEEPEFPHDIYEVFAAEKKKHEPKASKAPELATPPQHVNSRTSSGNSRSAPQFRYQPSAEDERLVSELRDYLMQGRLSLATPAHVFAASPSIRKDVVERLKVRRVEAHEYEEVGLQEPGTQQHEASTVRTIERIVYEPLLPASSQHHLWQPDRTQAGKTFYADSHARLSPTSPDRPIAFCLPLRELDILLNGAATTPAIYDTGSQIVVIRQDLVDNLGVYINPNRLIEMEGANGATNWTVGCVDYLPIQIGSVSCKIHAYVVEHASYGLLLGRPFQQALLCRFEDLPSGEVEISVRDPSNIARRVFVPSRPRPGRAPGVHVISVLDHTRSHSPSALDPVVAHRKSLPRPSIDATASVLKYKKVAQKVRPVPATLPEDFRNIRRIPVDPLLSLPPLPTRPPDFTPGARLTQERLDDLALNAHNFLWPEEVKLLHHVLKVNELGLAWTEAEKGRFSDEYFSPVKIPVVEHVPWAHKNIPVPPGIIGDVIQIFKDKFAAGVYEHSDASYRSRWFCVAKKSGALRLVHDLQPLNAITIRNSGIPPVADQVIEAMAGRACYSMLDLFVGYDHRTLDSSSRDLTTIQSPIGAVRLTCLPQGWTNAGAIFHEDVTFILEPEIPDVAWPFMDDCSIKGPATRYETNDGGFETIPDNDHVRRFVWEHLNDVHRILHRLHCAGATVSASKLFIAVPEVVILGHKCNYEGRVPDDSKIAKIRDWPNCKSLADVRAFLGLAGYMRIWIKGYSTIARPLVDLTRKGALFVWQDQHEQAMQVLKDAIIQSPALVSIDYSTDRAVYLSVDSSVRGVGWILAQDCPDGRRRPARFGSVSWNERESHYSQAKIELYGLFRALRAMRLHLVGIRNLIVEMDASYIKGMLSNPDVQPNATINRWIAAILLFDFKLVHVPANKHRGPDGLSRREPAPDEDEGDDPEDWIDHALSLGIWAVSWCEASPTNVFRTEVLAISTEDADAPSRRPRRDRRLPARYRTGDFISTDTTLARDQLLDPDPVIATSAPVEDVEERIDRPTLDNNDSSSPDLGDTNLDLGNLDDDDADSPDQYNIIYSAPDMPANDDSAPIKLSSSDKANKADEAINAIRQYPISRRAPPDLHGDALTRFISRADRFLFAGDDELSHLTQEGQNLNPRGGVG
jgi:hypothetical protein